MKRDPDGKAAQAMEYVGWEVSLQRLTRYACSLGYTGPDAPTGGVVEAMDLVQTLCERALAGELVWKLPPDATKKRILGHMCRRLRGMRSHQRQHDEVAPSAGEEELAELIDDTSDPEEAAVWTSHLENAQSALEGDDETLQLLDAFTKGYAEPQEAADHLAWSVPQVRRVRARMMRRFRDESLETTTDREDEPPSSGPRGGQDESQATQERQGALREPDRSAQHPRRRRR
jgi:hypothetical protein